MSLALFDPPLVVCYDHASNDVGVLAKDGKYPVVLWASDGEIDHVEKRGNRWVLRDHEKHPLPVVRRSKREATTVFTSWKTHNPEIAT